MTSMHLPRLSYIAKKVIAQFLIVAILTLQTMQLLAAGFYEESNQYTTPCPNPGVCFISQEAKDKWAKEHQCVFKEVSCEDTEPQVGANDTLQAKASAMARFADGLIDGLKAQLIDLWEFFKQVFTNPGEVWEGIKTIGKMVIEDPQAAWQIFITLLGDDAQKLLKCGAYDQGKVIGKYVSPFFALKVVNIVAKGGKLAEAVSKAKKTVFTAAEKLKLGIKFLPNVKMPNGASWFDEPSIKKRGVGIENALGNNTPDSFPVVDIIDKATGEVTSIKSKSPTAQYWTKEGGLVNSLKTDIRALADFLEDGQKVTSKWEKTSPNFNEDPVTLTLREVNIKTLKVAVKQGTLTEDHYAQIRQAQVYADKLVAEGRSTKPIKIVVVEIP